MREIEFRGKEKTIGWVYGSLLCFGANEYAIHLRNAEGSLIVDPETIGQFTGLYDKKRTDVFPKGQKIYEDDICLCDVNGIDYITIVYFKHGTYYLQDNVKEGNLSLSWFIDNNKNIEVIGNIHDNPELLTKIGRKT